MLKYFFKLRFITGSRSTLTSTAYDLNGHDEDCDDDEEVLARQYWSKTFQQSRSGYLNNHQ